MVKQKEDEDEGDIGEKRVSKALKVDDTKCIATKTQKMNLTYVNVMQMEVHDKQQV